MATHSTKLLVELLQRDIDAGHHRASESVATQMRQEKAATKPQPTQEPPKAATPAPVRETPRPAPVQATPSAPPPDAGAFVRESLGRRAQEVEQRIGSALDARFKGGRTES